MSAAMGIRRSRSALYERRYNYVAWYSTVASLTRLGFPSRCFSGWFKVFSSSGR